MSRVNQAMYGQKENWVAKNVYNASIEDKDRVKFACFDNSGQDSGTLLCKGLENNNITLENPLDSSISYCGLGIESPLSNISFYRGLQVYPIGYGGDLTYEDLRTEDIKVQTNNITNFALGSMYSDSQYVTLSQRKILDTTNVYLNQQHQRWQPKGHPNYRDNYDRYYGIIMQATMLTQIPVKNTILVPQIWAYDSISGTGSRQVRAFTLEDYLNTDNTYNYTNYPYVYSAGITVYTKTRPQQGQTTEMWGNVPLNSCIALNATSLSSGLKADTTLDAQGEIMGQTIDYSYNNGPVNVFNYIPIMGKLTDGTNPNFEYELNMNNDEDFNIVDGPYGQSSAGKAHSITYFAWGGNAPEVTYVTNGQTGQSASGKTWLHWTIDSINKAEQFYDDVMHAVACFGMFFVTNSTYLGIPLDDENMYLGILEDGVGHGQYSNGERNRDQDQWNWDDMHDNNYDPEYPTGLPDDFPDNSSYEKFDYTTTTPRGLWRPFVGSYIFDALGLNQLVTASTNHYIYMQDAIEQYNDYIVEHDIKKKELPLESYLYRQWGGKANPMDCFINVVHYPFDISRYIKPIAATSIAQVGSWVTPQNTLTSNISYKTTTSTIYGEINCGSVQFPVRTNPGANQISAKEFRSFAPYVSATLYLPFCGAVELDPEMYVDSRIGVIYVVDWRSGACMALIYRIIGDTSYVLDQSIPGQMGDTITLALQDSSSYAATLANASMQEQSLSYNKARNIVGAVQNGVNAVIGVGEAVATKGSSGVSSAISSTFGLVNNFITGKEINGQIQKANYDIGVSQVPTRRVGTAGPAVNSLGPMTIRLVFAYAQEENHTNFKSIMGHACLKFGQVKDSSGYTECSNMILDGISGATATEKSMIQSICAGGFYV